MCDVNVCVHFLTINFFWIWKFWIWTPGFNGFGKKQLQDETRNIEVVKYSPSYIRDVTVVRTMFLHACAHGPLARYLKLRVAQAPGMPGTFSPPPRVSDPDMYHVTCVTHVPWCVSGSPTSGFLWSRWRGKTFPAFSAHAQPAISRI